MKRIWSRVEHLPHGPARRPSQPAPTVRGPEALQPSSQSGRLSPSRRLTAPQASR